MMKFEQVRENGINPIALAAKELLVLEVSGPRVDVRVVRVTHGEVRAKLADVGDAFHRCDQDGIFLATAEETESVRAMYHAPAFFRDFHGNLPPYLDALRRSSAELHAPLPRPLTSREAWAVSESLLRIGLFEVVRDYHQIFVMNPDTPYFRETKERVRMYASQEFLSPEAPLRRYRSAQVLSASIRAVAQAILNFANAKERLQNVGGFAGRGRVPPRRNRVRDSE
jgi:hypothetical protein